MEIISVLIPTYNAEKYIFRLLSSLLKQQLTSNYKLEIIIIDSSSTDDTVEIIRSQFPDVLVKIIKNREFDHGRTRNNLAEISSGDYLLFMTQDAIPTNDQLLLKLLNSLEDKNTLISFARQIPKDNAGELERFARNYNYPSESIVKSKDSLDSLGIKTFFNSNVCSMYKREVFTWFGGFPNNIILNEDMILASKVILNNYNVVYCADGSVYHSHNYNLKHQFKRYFDIGMAFHETNYLLKYVSNEKEGKRMVLSQQRYLISNGLIFLIPVSLLETVVKYTGYLLGKRHNILPKKIKKSFSYYLK